MLDIRYIYRYVAPAKNCCYLAAKQLHEKKGIPPNEIIDVIMTVDGT